ncbi:hypothetical protein [Prochlorococcus marinus]|uniref:hypothetical protein n=1 Tax=Prochlorococcus marinus TaxID=1219 RepID=UPI0022B3F737|nr:hypothetical protein [Prochlorococcus marinus]
MGRSKTPKVVPQSKYWRIQRNGVISLIWNSSSPEEVPFASHVNTSPICVISHA